MEKEAMRLYLIKLVNYLEHSEIKINITQDRLNGIAYAVATLPEEGKQWIVLRFREGLSPEATAGVLGLTWEQEKKLEHRTVRKLWYTSRRDWILYGIEGNLKRTGEMLRAEGYEKGYRKGVEDACGGKMSPDSDSAAFNIPVYALSVSSRVRHRLMQADFATVGDVLIADKFTILGIPGMGKQGRKEVVQALRKLGIWNTAWEV